MNFLQNITIGQRIQIVVAMLLVFLYASSGVIVYRFSSKRLEQGLHKQMVVYLNSLSSLINEVEKHSELGFNQNDYTSLKPYFNQSAYFSTDFPFLLDPNGNYLIHIYREGQRFSRERLNIMYSNPLRGGNLEYFETRNNEKHRILLFYKRIEPYNAIIGVPVSFEEAKKDLNQNRFVLITIVVLCSLIFILVINYTLKPIVNRIVAIHQSLSKMAMGEPVETIPNKSNDEVGQIIQSLNKLIGGLSKTAEFANEIGKNNLESDFTPLGSNDRLGNSLLNMRESLKKFEVEQAIRKEEDERQNWINSGLAKFSDILRHNNNDLHRLSDNVMENLLGYLNANQGGLFVLTDEIQEEPHLELLSAYAYNRKKSKKKSILLGEGLVGNCAVEKQTIYLKEIPEDYIEITSGLGDAPPRCLLITPLKIEDKVFGVLEIASFNEFKKHEIEFIEKIGETIASTLSSVKNSIRTTQLLEQSRQQSEEMQAQEEEMRQNMEEMQATQEEMARKTLEMEGMTSAINEALIFCELSEQGDFVLTNNNFHNLVGFAKPDMEDKRLLDFIHPDNKILFREAWNSVQSGTPYNGVLKWTNRGSQELYVLCSITSAFNEHKEIYKVFLLGQDVTESKQIELKAQQQAEEIELSLIELQTEQELASQRQAEMEALLNALDTTCLVSEFDSNGKILFINNKNVEVLGDSKEEIEGKLHSDLDYEAKAHPEEFKLLWDNLLSGKPQTREFSLNVKGKNVWISEHFTPIKDERGNIVKIINIGIDITEGKEAEIRLKKQIDELERKLNHK